MPSNHDNEWVARFLPKQTSKVDVSDDTRRLFGRAIVFSVRSQDLGGFREVIAPSAVDRTLREGTNVDALLDHRRETTAILGSTDSGLLRLRKAGDGLHVEVSPPDTTVTRDLMTVVRSGLVKGMSFRFRPTPGGQEWDDAEGMLTRTIHDMQFSEVSFVVSPAYLETSAHARTAEVDRLALEAYHDLKLWRPSRAFRERQLRAGAR